MQIVGRLWHVDTLPIPLAHAIAIHEASGHNYLIEGGWSVLCSKTREGIYRVSNLNHSMVFCGRSLIEAMHAAIMAHGG